MNRFAAVVVVLAFAASGRAEDPKIYVLASGKPLKVESLQFEVDMCFAIGPSEKEKTVDKSPYKGDVLCLIVKAKNLSDKPITPNKLAGVGFDLIRRSLGASKFGDEDKHNDVSKLAFAKVASKKYDVAIIDIGKDGASSSVTLAPGSQESISYVFEWDRSITKAPTIIFSLKPYGLKGVVGFSESPQVLSK